MSEQRYVSVIVVDDGGDGTTRSFRVSYGRLRLLAAAAVILAVVLVAMVGSWWYLAARASRVSVLEEELAAAEAERGRVRELAGRLEELEDRYTRIRGLFGSDSTELPTGLWLPEAAGRTSMSPDSTGGVPSSWPLSTRGFVTRPLLAGVTGDHPGVDIAVPMDSYIRAAGAGEVADAGENEIYGRYVILDHGNGYRTRYAHASRLFVEAGRRVGRHEVIALSGSTGRSTAPHLHFEVLLDGEPVDPLTLVERP